MLAVTTWILAATGALVDAQTIPTPTAYSYSYTTETPTMAPTTETMAPTRTETYAPSRMTEAPSYAPTTETYAPSSSPTSTAAPTCNASCPPDILAVPTSMCPEDATDIPRLRERSRGAALLINGTERRLGRERVDRDQ